MMTYVLGAVLVLAVVAGAWYFRSKNSSTAMTVPTSNEPIVVSTPTPGPITGLACDQQYYNPKVGYAEYFLSADGGDLSNAKRVTCEFTAKVGGEVVASSTAESALVPAPARNGSTFHCNTPAVKLKPNVPTVIDVVLTDDLKVSSTCAATFSFPQP